MLIDENRIPHAFCIGEHWLLCACCVLTFSDHSEIVAEKVAPWIEEMIIQDRKSSSDTRTKNRFPS